jgi:DNA-binding CsgD family transcriptional regulator
MKTQLTRREAEIMGLIAAGMTNPEIAAGLFITIPSLRQHINHIFRKLGARDRSHAIVLSQKKVVRERIELVLRQIYDERAYDERLKQTREAGVQTPGRRAIQPADSRPADNRGGDGQEPRP